MKLIAGLGNPGSKYQRTRHNVGFRVLDRVAQRLDALFDREKYQALIAEARHGRESVLLLKPQTYMNLSGASVVRALRYKGGEPEDLLVVVDDVNLALGRVRLRQEGSAGGHNGLKSVIEHLGTLAFARLRVGIGAGGQSGDLTDHVLGKFAPDEEPLMDKAVERAADAVLSFIEDGAVATMNRYND